VLDGVVTEGRPSAEVAKLAASPRGNRQLRRVVQFVGQDTSSSFDPRWTLRRAIRKPARQLRGLSTAEADREIDALLVELGLDPAAADRYPSQVSGGQRQRFSLARGLVVRPRILMCDEVVSALDVSVQGSILNLVKRYCREHECGLVFVSHGLPATAFIADEIIVMKDGKVVERGPSGDVLRNPQHPYTARLVAAYRGR
jgi:peptide/nickel transport system ATP-binding protein